MTEMKINTQEWEKDVGPPLLYGWVDTRTLKSKYLIGLGRKEKGIKTLEVQLCEGPFIQKRKTGILRDVKIFCATSETYIM